MWFNKKSKEESLDYTWENTDSCIETTDFFDFLKYHGYFGTQLIISTGKYNGINISDKFLDFSINLSLKTPSDTNTISLIDTFQNALPCFKLGVAHKFIKDKLKTIIILDGVKIHQKHDFLPNLEYSGHSTISLKKQTFSLGHPERLHDIYFKSKNGLTVSATTSLRIDDTSTEKVKA